MAQEPDPLPSPTHIHDAASGAVTYTASRLPAGLRLGPVGAPPRGDPVTCSAALPAGLCPGPSTGPAHRIGIAPDRGPAQAPPAASEERPGSD